LTAVTALLVEIKNEVNQEFLLRTSYEKKSASALIINDNTQVRIKRMLMKWIVLIGCGLVVTIL
jgi:hypothetical protein